MKQEVTLTEQEVNQALLDYAANHGVRFEGMSATVAVVAGRGERGVYATIALEPESSLKYHKISEEGKLTSVNTPEASLPELEDEGVPVEVEPAEDDIDPDTQVFS